MPGSNWPLVQILWNKMKRTGTKRAKGNKRTIDKQIIKNQNNKIDKGATPSLRVSLAFPVLELRLKLLGLNYCILFL